MTDRDVCQLPECDTTVLSWLDPDFCSLAHRADARSRRLPLLGLLNGINHELAGKITVLDESYTHNDADLTAADIARTFDVDERLLITTTAHDRAPAETGVVARLRRWLTGVVTR